MNTNRWSGVSSEEVPAGRSPVASCRGAGTQHRGVGRAGSPWVVQGRGSRLAREEPSPLGRCWGRKKWGRGKGEVVLQLGFAGEKEKVQGWGGRAVVPVCWEPLCFGGVVCPCDVSEAALWSTHLLPCLLNLAMCPK